MVIGLVASLVVVIYRSCRPHVSSLGRVPTEQGAFSDLERNPEAVPVPGILIIRPDAQLYYANALTVRDKVNAMIRAMDPPPRAVVFDGAAQDTLDLTTRDVLIALVRRLEEQHITVVFADAHAPIIEAAGESVFGAPQEHRVFATVDAAVRHLAAQEDSQPAPADAAGRSELVQ
jgi:SulP family sulfate permease